MKKLLILLPMILLSAFVFGQPSTPTKVIGDSSITNLLIVRPVPATQTQAPVKLYAVTGLNTSNTVVYVQIHQTTTNPPANATPLFSYPIPASSGGSTGYYYIDFDSYGADLQAATVVMSTSSNTYVRASACATIQAIIKSP